MLSNRYDYIITPYLASKQPQETPLATNINSVEALKLYNLYTFVQCHNQSSYNNTSLDEPTLLQYILIQSLVAQFTPLDTTHDIHNIHKTTNSVLCSNSIELSAAYVIDTCMSIFGQTPSDLQHLRPSTPTNTTISALTTNHTIHHSRLSLVQSALQLQVFTNILKYMATTNTLHPQTPLETYPPADLKGDLKPFSSSVVSWYHQLAEALVPYQPVIALAMQTAVLLATVGFRYILLTTTYMRHAYLCTNILILIICIYTCMCVYRNDVSLSLLNSLRADRLLTASSLTPLSKNTTSASGTTYSSTNQHPLMPSKNYL